MAKKQKKATSERVPTKHQLSRWQRQMKIRRIVIIAAVVFLVGIAIWVGLEWRKDYEASTAAWREVVIKVNGVPFTMEYFVNMLDAYTKNMESDVISLWADYVGGMVADEIINAELLGQGAKSLNITVTPAEIEARLQASELPDNEANRDIVRPVLLQEKLEEYFGSQLPDTMEQAHAQIMLVESEEVADEVLTKIETGINFTYLVEEFSCNSSFEGDLGWLPRELMPNTLIADAAFNLTLGEISQPIYDETATKDVGYWLIEVTDKEDDKIKARVMLLGSEAEAEQVKAELVSKNFSSLAKEYSQHESKTKGGELDWFKRGDMGSTAFDAIAFNTTANQVTEPVKDESVQTTGGYWLVKVVDRGERELAEEVKEELIGKHFNDWFEEWKKSSTIENLLNNAKRTWAVNEVLKGR